MYKFAMSAAIMCVNQTAPADDMDYVIGHMFAVVKEAM